MTAVLEDVAPQYDIDDGNRQRTPQHKLVRVSDGTTIAVEDWRPPTSPEHNVVFLHGFCLSHQEWLNQIDSVTEEFGREVRAIALDHRGHGRSSAADMKTYTISQCANDLAEVLAVLKVEGPVTFVGHSMGGMIAIEYQSLPKNKKPVDPANIILVATAAGHLVQSGIGRLLGTRATTALFDVVHHTPETAWRLASG
ncbi:alpha/beta fold hydrolase, partial [Mycolicibacterium llatzerense]|uniref:alpha/beta fold hydrolase n=1 Tax=Mycolicibacterium llatzerense TaxID=280871 RepID=UPI0013A7086B